MAWIEIRAETEADYRIVEELTREAFWNVYAPGCYEHYLAHTMRSHADFVPQLDLVLAREGQIIGNIMYTKAWLTDETGDKKEILTFGPLSILPAFQKRGYSRQLIESSVMRAEEMGYEAIVIFGSPERYVGRGFVSCKRHRICLPDGTYPTAMLVRVLKPGVLDGSMWTYEGSAALECDAAAAEDFDKGFAPREKAHTPSQESFSILSRSVLR